MAPGKGDGPVPGPSPDGSRESLRRTAGARDRRHRAVVYRRDIGIYFEAVSDLGLPPPSARNVSVAAAFRKSNLGYASPVIRPRSAVVAVGIAKPVENVVRACAGAPIQPKLGVKRAQVPVDYDETADAQYDGRNHLRVGRYGRRQSRARGDRAENSQPREARQYGSGGREPSDKPKQPHGIIIIQGGGAIRRFFSGDR